MAGYKRFGVDQGNIDLEKRLRTIEQAIKLKADANAASDVSSQSRIVPLQVNNVVITGGTQSWRLEWSSVTAPDLKQYIVQVSETSTFNEFTDYDVDTPYFEYTVQPGITDVVNYARVRAVTNIGYEGPWSRAYDIASGLLVSIDFEQGATTGFVHWTQTSFPIEVLGSGSTGQNPYTYDSSPPGWGPPLSGDPPSVGGSDIYGPIHYTAVDGGVVFPYIALDCKYASSFNHVKVSQTSSAGRNFATLTVKLYRRPTGGEDEVVNWADTDFYITTPQSPGWQWNLAHLRWALIDTARTRFFFPGLPDLPGQGAWEYRIGISCSSGSAGGGGGGILVEPLKLQLVLFEFRR
jgi:hypothetical protein